MKKPDKIVVSRRRALLGAAGISAAAAAWHKPIVNAVLLPAHAQTSDVAAVTTAAPTVAFFAASLTPVITKNSSPLDMLIAPAMAGVAPRRQFTVAAQQTDTEGQVFDVQLLQEFEFGGEQGIDTADVLFEGSLTLGSSSNLPPRTACEVEIKSLEVELVEVNIDESGGGEGNILLEIDGEGILNVPEGNETIGEPQCEFVTLQNSYFERPLRGFEQDKTASESSVLDFFVSSANANEIQRLSGLKAERVSGNTFTVSALGGDPQFGFDFVIWSGDVEGFNESAPLSNVSNPCSIPNLASVEATIIRAGDDSLTIELFFSDEHIEFHTIPAADGMLVVNTECPR